MKSAVIMSGGKQYLVKEGDSVVLELLADAGKKVEFEALLVVDGKDVKVGKPIVPGVKVVADVTEADAKADKVTAIRFKAKKRVKKIHGHRQRQTTVKIVKIG